jgi:hypothetical protein
MVSATIKGTTAGAKNNSVSVSSANAGQGNTSSVSLTVVVPPTISKAFRCPRRRARSWSLRLPTCRTPAAAR